jgi:lactoylglutathione lyase
MNEGKPATSAFSAETKLETSAAPRLSAPGILGLYEAHLTVSQLGRSVAFYRDVVGLEFAKAFPARGAAFFWIDSKKTGMLGLWETGLGPQSMRLHIALRMSREGVLQSAAALKANQVQPLGFNGEPLDEPVAIGWMPAIAQYFHDPDGHLIEFICVLDDEPDADFGVQPYSSWLARRTSRAWSKTG